jgi:hypothetical protein
VSSASAGGWQECSIIFEFRIWTASHIAWTSTSKMENSGPSEQLFLEREQSKLQKKI